MSYLTDREIHVIGIQRTGQHAITSWLIGHFEKVCYKNSMSQLGMKKHDKGVQPPFWYFEPSIRDDWEVSEEQIKLDQDAIILGTEFKVYEVGLNPNINSQKQEITKDLGVDLFSKSQDYVLVIRNPYNHYASVLNWQRNKQLSPVKDFSEMWKKMAKECLEDTNCLPGPKTVVKYDDWFSSKEYRENLSKSLCLDHTDRRLNTVMKIGVGRSWGSSFDGMKKKDEAQSMSVLSRWEKAKDDPRFIKLAEDEELVALASRLGWEKPL